MKKIICLVLCMMLVIVCAVGCTPTASAPDDSKSEPAAEGASSSEATPSDEKGDGEVVEIDYFHFMNTPYIEPMQRSFQIFAEENPGYKIVEEAYSGDNYVSILKSRIASGNIPDMWLRTDSFLALDQWADVSLDLSDYDFWDNLSPDSKVECTYDGKAICFPFTSNTFGLLVNLDVMEANGITEMPTTLSELEAICKKLSDAGVTPFCLSMLDQWSVQQAFYWTMGSTLGKTSDIMNRFAEYTSGAAKVSDDDWMQSNMKLFQLVKDYSQPNPFSTDWTMGSQMLGKGEVAMYIQGDWTEEPALQANPDANLATWLLPVSDDPKDSKVYLSYAARTIFVSKDSPDIEGCIKYIEWLCSDSGVKWYNEDLKCIAPINGVAPTGKGTSLISTGTGLIDEYGSDAVGCWAEYCRPSDLDFENIQEEFFAGNMDQQQVVDFISDTWYDYSQK